MIILLKDLYLENEGDPVNESITFLYKFIHGACHKSYGFNAARLASLPDQVIKCAREKSAQFEASANKKKIFQSFFKEKSDVNDLIQALRKI